MTAVNRILDEYDRVWQGNAWHGDSIWKILDGISAECAGYRANAGIHTIWEIVMHMTFWEGVATRRLAGQKAGLDEALNFPAQPEPTEANWQTTRDELRASNLKFREALARLDTAMLDKLSAAGKRTFYDEAHGVIQHDVYHAGQIALLKKCFQPHSRSAGL